MSAVLEIGELRKAFGGVEAVVDLSFRLNRGDLCAVIGPNGAGKTTCFNLIGGQLRPDSGTIALEGRGINGLPAWRICGLGIGRTFQVAALFGSLTVRQNVEVALLSRTKTTHRMFRAADRHLRSDVDSCLADVGLLAQAERPSGILAHGDVKRLELAMALAGNPKVLLLDEPAAGVATAERRGLMSLIVRCVRERGISVLFTEHDMDTVFDHATRVLVLSRGRLIADGAPADVRADARVRDLYLGAGPSPGAPPQC